jgi:hypothetical protein
MPTQGWLDRFINAFGLGTDAYKSKVDAEFPETALDGIIPRSYGRCCVARSADALSSAGQF